VIQGAAARPPAPARAAKPAAREEESESEAASDDGEPGSRRVLVLFIALGALAVLAVGLVLYFVLRAG
jgi:hypothetical protein